MRTGFSEGAEVPNPDPRGNVVLGLGVDVRPRFVWYERTRLEAERPVNLRNGIQRKSCMAGQVRSRVAWG